MQRQKDIGAIRRYCTSAYARGQLQARLIPAAAGGSFRQLYFRKSTVRYPCARYSCSGCLAGQEAYYCRMEQIGFGGGCHWCTEAVFQSLKGVGNVLQGWIAPAGAPDRFSEAVLLDFDPRVIPLSTLIAVHLSTHSSTAEHAMRGRYRSAVYTCSPRQARLATGILADLQVSTAAPIITRVLPFRAFRLNEASSLNYYYTDPERPFCQTHINPKLRLLLAQFSATADPERLSGLQP